MKIGILSDTHGKISRLGAALQVLQQRQVDAIVHCGDLGSVECMQALSIEGIDAYAVAGNTDHHVGELEAAALKLGVTFHSEVVEVHIGNDQHLVATHGHDERVLNELIKGQQFPYVCHGHTHRFRDERYHEVRVICPGALHNPREPRNPSAVLLDTDTDELEQLDIPKKPS